MDKEELKTLIKEVILEMKEEISLPYGYWLDKNGNFHDVDINTGHAGKAKELLGSKSKDIQKLGYIRIVNDKDAKTIFYDCDPDFPITSSQKKALKNLAIESEFKLVCDNTGKEVDLLEEKENSTISHSNKPLWKNQILSMG